MATLVYNPAFRADATYDESIVVYGETAVTRDYPDSLAVEITVAEMNALLSFTKDGENAAADFTVDLSGISAKVKSALETRLEADHPSIDLVDIGVDARSILSHSKQAWTADVSALDVPDTAVTARNIYEQAADKGKLDAVLGKLAMSAGESFSFYMDTKASQSLSITIDSADLSGATPSDVAPLIPSKGANGLLVSGVPFGQADKGTFSKDWDYKFTVTLTAA